MTNTGIRTILFLAANPDKTVHLNLEREEREIDQCLRLAKQRDKFVLQKMGAIRDEDLQRWLFEIAPQIVHFSGHGARENGIVLEDRMGKPQTVPTSALAELFELCETNTKIECVLLNACYSEEQARVISQHIDYVIGMSRVIGDKSATLFSEGFYTGLAAGLSYEAAYRLGCNRIRLRGLGDATVPRLWKKPGQPLPYPDSDRAATSSSNREPQHSASGARIESRNASSLPNREPRPSSGVRIEPRNSPNRSPQPRRSESFNVSSIVQKAWIAMIAIAICWSVFGTSSRRIEQGDFLSFMINGGLAGSITGMFWGWARCQVDSRMQWDQIVLAAMFGIVAGTVSWTIICLVFRIGSTGGGIVGTLFGLILVAVLIWDLSRQGQRAR